MTKKRDVTQIQARVSELLAEYGIPSAAIGVLHDGEFTDFAVGVKNVSTKEPATYPGMKGFTSGPALVTR